MFSKENCFSKETGTSFQKKWYMRSIWNKTYCDHQNQKERKMKIKKELLRGLIESNGANLDQGEKEKENLGKPDALSAIKKGTLPRTAKACLFKNLSQTSDSDSDSSNDSCPCLEESSIACFRLKD